ncbi:MAG TPA: hypothetical protein VKT75_13535 [Acidobacteriaceae bacterium]|nr:hypothetical protein [Acidobacteriaceae bacterium]
MPLFVSNPRREAEGESGFVLLAVIFLTLLLLITLAIAAPKMAMSIQRDKDLETMHRGEQYKRAIQLYYRQFGRYPTSVDQLVQTNNIRFLRKRYVDPETGKDDWKPVVYGRAHVRPLGFFGQPLSAAAGAVAVAAMGNASMGMYAPDSSITKGADGLPVSNDGSGPGMSGSMPAASSSGPGSTGASNSGTFSMGGGQSNSGLGSSSSGFGSSSFGGSSFGSGQSGSSFGSPMGGANPGTGAPGTGAPGMGSQNATSFGGSQGPIVGVTLPVDKASILIYKKQDHYNKWEFNYDPVEDQMKAAASLFGGGSAMGSGMPGGTTPGAGGLGGSQTGSGFGNSGSSFGNNGSSFGQSGLGGSGSPSPSPSPTPQPSPTNPQ